MSVPADKRVMWLDWAVIAILAIGAGCGIVYEYLISHYAGRVLGAIEVAIYGVITVMMATMGLGSFLARKIKDPFTGFAWLEVLLALLGSASVLLIAGIFAMANLFPQVLADTFGLPPDLIPSGGMVTWASAFAEASPYVVGGLLGLMIGMEIPLIGEVRAHIHRNRLKNNAGTIYGFDYIGAGVGASLWLYFMLSMDVPLAAAITASANLLVGLLFLVLFRHHVRWKVPLLATHLATAGVVIMIALNGANWDAQMEDLLYQDKVIYRLNTQHQHLTVTERIMDPTKLPLTTFYINGRTQFSSFDEHMYHAMLVYPALAASARREAILIVGGGDGLALREVLRWEPRRVVLLDLDREVVAFFTHPVFVDGRQINKRLLSLNEHAFSDPRVETRFGDAFITSNDLLEAGEIFDAVIVDLPDPGHPDLNKLYSARFYAKLHGLLAGDGAMSVQSTSPYHAKHAFLSIGKTIKYAGFQNVDQYHHNVPSFGEWGWTIATKNGLSGRQRIERFGILPVDDGWTTRGLMLAAFEFGKHYFDELNEVQVNRLGSMVAYQYHHRDWETQLGIFEPSPYDGKE